MECSNAEYLRLLRDAALTRAGGTNHRLWLVLWFAVLGWPLIGSFALALAWAVLTAGAQALDRWAALRVVQAINPDKVRRAGVWFFAACGLSSLIFPQIAVMAWFMGGEAGRVAALFTAAGALVHTAVLAHRIRLLFVILGGPYLFIIVAPLFSLPNLGGHFNLIEGVSVTAAAAVFLLQIQNAFSMNRAAMAALEAARSEAEQRREAAEAASRAKSEFLANMSHELRTPLNAIINYSEILEEDLSANGQAEQRDDAMRVSSAGRHLLSLINEVLDLAKVEAGHAIVNVEAVDVATMARDLLDALRPVAEGKGLYLKLELDSHVDVIVTDSLKLKQCLLNLLANACKFTERGGVTLTILCRREAPDPIIEFVVADTGIGIEPAKHEAVFRPFEQADGSITRRFGGAGLGLTITREFTHLLGGRLTLQSTPSVGTAITMTLPSIYRAAERAESPSALLGAAA